MSSLDDPDHWGEDFPEDIPPTHARLLLPPTPSFLEGPDDGAGAQEAPVEAGGSNQPQDGDGKDQDGGPGSGTGAQEVPSGGTGGACLGRAAVPVFAK